MPADKEKISGISFHPRPISLVIKVLGMYVPAATRPIAGSVIRYFLVDVDVLSDEGYRIGPACEGSFLIGLHVPDDAMPRRWHRHGHRIR